MMDDLFSHHLEEKYITNSTVEHRKKYAQFFTPYRVAQFMAAWVMGGSREIKTILDPSVGLGVFIRAIREYLGSSLATSQVISQVNIKGYDIDPQILAIAQQQLQQLDHPENIELLGQDYLFHDWESSYDAIICNPPYFKFQDFKTKNRALQEFSDRLSINLTGFTNIYALFLLKSLHQLQDHGRCAYIIPSEFLNSDYGKTVKTYLLQYQSLRYVIIFNSQENLFDRALTTSCILLFCHDHQAPTIEFINITSLQDLNHLGQKLNLYPHQPPNNRILYNSLNPNIKWRGYYQETHTHKYQNLIDFSAYAKVSRGIATGANDYFLFTREKAQALHISEQHLLPVISKANQVTNSFFRGEDFQKLARENKPIYLFNANAVDNQDLQVKKYILWGESLGIHQKYLTSHRNPWYAIEQRLPSPIWVSVFSRGGIRFIRNETAVRNLTTFHCIYLKPLAMDKIDLLFAYLLTDVARNIFADHRREYGGGLEKFEPNDLNHAQVIDLEKISSLAVSKILYYYHQYKNSLLVNQENTNLLSKINDLFLEIIKY